MFVVVNVIASVQVLGWIHFINLFYSVLWKSFLLLKEDLSLKTEIQFYFFSSRWNEVRGQREKTIILVEQVKEEKKM